MKKILSAIIVFALLITSVAFASVAPTADKSTLRGGDSLYVTVSASEPITGLYGIDYKLYFDAAKFDYDCAGSTIGTASDLIQISAKAFSDAKGAHVLITLVDFEGVGATIAAGEMCKIAFAAKADIAAGSADFTLEKSAALDTARETFTDEAANVAADGATISVTTEVAPVHAESVTLDSETLNLKLGETAQLSATVLPENAENKNIIWNSSNESIATVENGLVSAVATGTAVISAVTEDGAHAAQCTVSITRTAQDSYAVRMVGDQSASVGDQVSVYMTVEKGLTESDTYNAAYIEIRYPAALLEYVNAAADDDTTVVHDAENGTIKLLRYGADAACGGTFATFEFVTRASGSANVAFAAAKVDASANASMQDAPDATMLNDGALIQIGGYKVNLSDDFRGNANTTPDQDYTFEAVNKNYDYTIIATIGDANVNVTDNGNGTYTIAAADITGEITVTATKTGKTFNVAKYGTGAGDVTLPEEKPRYGTDYVFAVNKAANYTYTVTATVGGKSVDVTAEGANYTISGSTITGNVVLTIVKTYAPPVVRNTIISFSGAAEGEVVGGLTQTAETGKAFTFSLNKSDAYTYTVKIGAMVIEPNADGSYTIPAAYITGGTLTVTIEKAGAALSVEAYEYLKIREAETETAGSSVWLIVVNGTPESGKTFAFDGIAMFTSEKYDNAYCYLMISGDAMDDVKTEAAARISQIPSESANPVIYDLDVNKTGKADINDAQLVYDMYGARKYVSFDYVSVEKFLRADVNGDKQITVLDANSIVAELKK